MADNSVRTPGSGESIRTVEIVSGAKTGVSKLDRSSTSTESLVGSSTPLYVIDDAAGTLLTSIKTAVEILDNTVAGSEAQVDVITVPAPLSTTGGGTEAAALRVTVASDSTGVLSIDDNGGSLTVDNAGLTELAAAINASSQMDVNIAASAATLTVASHAVTNAGTFAVQDATAQASLSVMDDWDNTASDGASVSGDVAHDAVDAGEPVKIGGYASAAAPTGVSGDADRVAAWFLRNGAQAMVVTAAGALIGGDATNGLDVDVTRVTGTVTVDGSGVTQPVSNAGLTELAAAINASSQMDVNIAASAATLTVASHAVTNAGTFVVQENGAALTALQLIDNLVLAEDAAHVSADPGVQVLAVRKATPANLSGLDGDYEPLQISAGRVWASATIDTALPAGTNAIGKLAANSGVDIGDVDITSIAAGDNNIGNVDIVTMPNVTLAAGTNTNEVVGDAAHDAAVSGNPLLMGGVSSAAAPTDVSADQEVVRSWHLRNGAQATVLTAAGALIGGDAANGLDVDVTRLPALVASSANIGTVKLVNSVAGNAIDTIPMNADGLGGSFYSASGMAGFTYNGTTWDRIRSVIPGGAAGVGVQHVAMAFSYLNIVAGQATTVVKNSAGVLHSITFNGPATATNTTNIYDHASGAGTIIATPLATAVTAPVTLIFDAAFANGLTIITATANGANMTVCYR